ncbi:hypothetical protein DLAC_05363 [Tieghemostelium lacteum]|uniref:Brl1/Brr6 domain-containing protein n=1 Tax=Tieghemostelium lacteum TaxID=361077 RepID=A0A151ZFN7_TIELA|nr:hypothetical protein DLAC_05363 [Tieghemostelium lacteum]|eukprot:KYQ92783.1 hypothetical protein DLAC_05363 [Tieghemostelium lacteum]
MISTKLRNLIVVLIFSLFLYFYLEAVNLQYQYEKDLKEWERNQCVKQFFDNECDQTETIQIPDMKVICTELENQMTINSQVSGGRGINRFHIMINILVDSFSSNISKVSIPTLIFILVLVKLVTPIFQPQPIHHHHYHVDLPHFKALLESSNRENNNIALSPPSSHNDTQHQTTSPVLEKQELNQSEQ